MENKYIDAERLKAEIRRQIKLDTEYGSNVYDVCSELLSFITSLQQEQPEYGYLSTEYVYGKKPRWGIGDVLAYYINTSNEEGEYPLGKIVNVEFDEEDGWIYTFEDESTWDEQSLVEEGTYKKN